MATFQYVKKDGSLGTITANDSASALGVLPADALPNTGVMAVTIQPTQTPAAQTPTPGSGVPQPGTPIQPVNQQGTNVQQDQQTAANQGKPGYDVFGNPLGGQPQQPAPQGQQPTPQATAPVEQPLPVSSYTGPSIVDYLNSIGQPSDKASRAILAQKMGIQNYDYSAGKNTELLDALRNNKLPAAAATPQPIASNPAAQTAQPQAPATPTGKTPLENVMDAYTSIYKDLGLGDIKSAYEKTLNDQKELQDKLDDEISNINNNPWLSDGVRVKQVERAQSRYETRLNTLSNYAKLYDALFQEGRQTAQFLVGQVQEETQFAIQLAQRKQEALDALESDNHSVVEANGRKLLVNLKDGTIIADLGASDVGGAGGMNSNQISDNERALLGQFQQSPIVKDYNTLISQKLTVDRYIQYGIGGPANLALVYAFMKSLDPNSVVRETEYALAAKSGNIFAGAYAKFNGYLKENGGFLPENVKTEFQNLTNQRLQAQQIAYDNYAKSYREIAERQGLNPDNVVPNFGGALAGSQPSYPPGSTIVNNHVMYLVGQDGQTLTAIGSAL